MREGLINEGVRGFSRINVFEIFLKSDNFCDYQQPADALFSLLLSRFILAREQPKMSHGSKSNFPPENRAGLHRPKHTRGKARLQKNTLGLTLAPSLVIITLKFQ